MVRFSSGTLTPAAVIQEAATRAAIQARKEDLTAFADNILARPDKEKNLKAYQDSLSQRQVRT